MFKRIKKLWALSKKDTKALEGLTPEQIASIPDANDGDGKAEFFTEGTQDDYDEFQKEETGTKAWYDRIKRLWQQSFGCS